MEFIYRQSQILCEQDGMFEAIAILREQGCQHPCIVVSKTIANTARYKALCEQFINHAIHYSECIGAYANPSDTQVMQALALCQREGCDSVLAIGGGSVMDVGKAIAFMFYHEGQVMDYIHQNKVVIKRRLPLICIPTTCGSGSEISKNAVIAYESTGRKARIIDERLRADNVIFDPSILHTLPLQQLREGCIDALAHAIESYTSYEALTNINPYYDALSLQAISMLMEALPTLTQKPYTLDTLIQLQWGALLAGISMERDLNAGHHLAGAIHQHCPTMSHAIAVGIVLVPLMRYNYEACVERYERIAQVIATPLCKEMDLASSLLYQIQHVLIKMRIPTLSTYIGDDKTLKNFAPIIPPLCNPIPIDSTQALQIYQDAFTMKIG